MIVSTVAVAMPLPSVMLTVSPISYPDPGLVIVTVPPPETCPLPLVWIVPVAPTPARSPSRVTARAGSLGGKPDPLLAGPRVAMPPVS